jgi:ADP-ribose pyrophosphatase
MRFEYLGLEKCFRGHAFDVSKVHVRLPDDRERDYDLVEHADSVTILPLDSAGQIYFVSQHRVGARQTLLELPAGVLEKGESPLVGAKREIREEVGKAARIYRELGGFYLAPGYSDEFMTVFLATDLYDAPLAQDDDEFIHLEKIHAAHIFRPENLKRLQDGKTLASLLLARAFLLPCGADSA